MNRKIVAVWLSFVMVFGFVVVIVEITPSVRGITITVDDDGPADYSTIQAAINAADDGDTIFVYNGTYNENLYIFKTLNITGESSNSTIIIGGDLGYTVKLDADLVNLTNFTITSGNPWNSNTGLEICSNNNTISKNNIINNLNGLLISYTTVGNNILTNNISSSIETGIRLDDSDTNDIIGNSISSNQIGIYISKSKRINISNNMMMGNGVTIWGDSTEHWNTHEIGTSNTVNGKSIYYWKNQNTGIIPSNAGQVILANCSNISIENQKLMNCTDGIQLGFSSKNFIQNNKISNNSNGICLYNSHNNTVINNEVLTVIGNGILLSYSNNNSIKNNTFSHCEWKGISLSYSSNNFLIHNNITYNGYGVYVEYSLLNKIIHNNFVNDGVNILGLQIPNLNSHEIPTNNTVNGNPLYYYKDTKDISINGIPIGQLIIVNSTNISVKGIEIGNTDWGVKVAHSSNISMINNNISNNECGGITILSSNYIRISGNEIRSNFGAGIIFSMSTNNTISNNNIMSNNGYGINIMGSSYNSIFNNNIINNRWQAYDGRKDNNWNESYPGGGNFWSDYKGIDKLNGPNQDLPGSDGIGDTNYTIPTDNRDYYPLMTPVGNYIFLNKGWNLISLPYIQTNTDLEIILYDIQGTYSALQWYNITDNNDLWKHHKVGKPFGNDLFEINETMGFWIHITELGGVLFDYPGTQPTTNQTIQLHPGWNMVGYPSLTNHNRTQGLNNLTYGTHVDSIWTYYATTQKWEDIGPSDNFELGRGYWFHAKVECEWEVPL